jgi:hypothetical protein
MAPTKKASTKKAVAKKAPIKPTTAPRVTSAKLTTKSSNTKILTARKVSSLKASPSRAVSSHGSSPPPSVSEGPSSRRAFVTDEDDDTPSHTGSTLDASSDAVMVESDEDDEGDITMEAEECSEETDEELSKLTCFTEILVMINLPV